MAKALKWIGIVLGGLIGLLLLVFIGLVIYGQVNFKRTYADHPLYPITADTSPEGIARGEYLVRSVNGCAGCHHGPLAEGEEIDLDGPLSGHAEAIGDGPMQATFAPRNLTPDMETGLGSWSDAEIARAIREGLDKNGVALIIMPSYAYRHLSDADVAAIVGYLRSLEPVNNEVPPFDGNFFAKILSAMGAFGPANPTEPITEAQVAPEPGTAAYGEYLVNIGDCRACHQPNLAGGTGGEPGAALAPNLTPAGDLGNWSVEDFMTTLRTGTTPEGRQLDPEQMPWPVYGRMTDEDLADIFSYLQSLPAVESAEN